VAGYWLLDTGNFIVHCQLRIFNWYLAVDCRLPFAVHDRQGFHGKQLLAPLLDLLLLFYKNSAPPGLYRRLWFIRKTPIGVKLL
jgi:hypothetical protein